MASTPSRPLLHELLEPWAILPDHFRVLLEQSHALMSRDAVPVDGTCNVTMRGDVAVMHVKGPLFRYHSWVTAYLGTSSYGELRKDLQRVVDSQAKSTLVVFDSPGGEVNGLCELADAFYAARKQLPNMEAYVSGTCASAAYFIGSAVGPITCAPTSLLGSIGVITTLVDDSKMLADVGLKEYEIVSSQSPKKSQQPADAGYRGRVQQRIDDMADVFITRVAQYRGVGADVVTAQYGQGDALVGQRAVDAGIADKVGDVESVIARLQSRVDRAQQKKNGSNTFQYYGEIAHGNQHDGATPRARGERDRAADRGESIRAVGLPCGRSGSGRGEGFRRGPGKDPGRPGRYR